MTSDKGTRIIRGILSIGGSTLVQMAFGFLSVTIAARTVPEQDFGIYFLIVALVYLLEVIGDLGLRLSAARFVASAPSDDERQAIVSNLFTFRLLSVLVVCLLAIIARPVLLSLFDSALLSSLFFFALVLFAIQLVEGTLAYIMQGYTMYTQMAIVQLLTGVLNLAFALLFLLGFHMGVQGFILAQILPLLIAAVVRYILVPAHKIGPMNPAIVKRIVRFGLPLQGNDILTFVFQKLDVLLLGVLIGPAHIAYLEVAARVPNYLQRLYQSLQAVYFPHMTELCAKKQLREAAAVLNNFARLASFAAMSLALVAVLFQDQVIALIFSDKYLPSAPALGPIMIAVGIGMISTILDTALISAGRPAYLLGINLATASISLAGNALLIPILGFLGAAYAKVISSVLAHPVSVWCVRREQIAVQVTAYLRPVLFMLLCVALYLGSGWDNLWFKVLLLALFLLLSVIFAVFRWKDLVALRQSLKFARESG